MVVVLVGMMVVELVGKMVVVVDSELRLHMLPVIEEKKRNKSESFHFYDKKESFFIFNISQGIFDFQQHSLNTHFQMLMKNRANGRQSNQSMHSFQFHIE